MSVKPPIVTGDKLILVVFEEAIYNGVDALSISLDGSASSLLNDDMVAGSFHAAK
ncbi:hypothetical protein DEO72_LG9g2046 [Vigna unguiculata]|uniref:Uncharacterized protein n=1 Tax=Vigna unguiculata TaxID=3917 RepID=A0A4D6N2E9_VIGUN|nr:hypothetical protein DEO72_LG9g2046 [Vigna unguiculata]